MVSLYFISLAFATLTFDISMLGFESTPKENRDNLIIVISITRLVGIGLVCMLFYLLKVWTYCIIIFAGMTIICLPLFMRYVFESPHFILATTGNIDSCKYIVNCIGAVSYTHLTLPTILRV